MRLIRFTNEFEFRFLSQNMATGEVEVKVDELRVLNTTSQLPFPVSTTAAQSVRNPSHIASSRTGSECSHFSPQQTKEQLRLQYRFLDLRRTELQHNIRLRSKVAMAIRDILANEFGEFD
jgi:aspartyl-tRNA synthetase